VAEFYAVRDAAEESKAVDFDEFLLAASARLVRKCPQFEEVRNRFAYLHVDEYQDTNRVSMSCCGC